MLWCFWMFGVPVGVQEHRAFADRHRGAECGNVALGGIHGNYVYLRSISGAGLRVWSCQTVFSETKSEEKHNHAPGICEWTKYLTSLLMALGAKIWRSRLIKDQSENPVQVCWLSSDSIQRVYVHVFTLSRLSRRKPSNMLKRPAAD